MSYAAPLADMRFVLDEVAGLEEVAAARHEAAAADLVDAILDEAAKLAETVLAPLNQPADRIGSVLENGVVRTPPGFARPIARFVEGGWNGLAVDPEYGGQGLPLSLARGGRDVERRLHGLRPLPDAQRRRDRGAARPWFDRAKAALSRKDLGRVDRDDEPDRAAGRLAILAR